MDHIRMIQMHKNKKIERLSACTDMDSALKFIQTCKKSHFTTTDSESVRIHDKTKAHLQNLFDSLEGVYLLHLYELFGVLHHYGFCLELKEETVKRHNRALMYQRLATY